ncbi:hypothetical protein FOA43_004154 [Brettanomyces nanus]|uniref:Zn(2)-C6 fungal-type domain-containing protein n=1 Tax=Eeniella nana TaxID=13502 RepID=A0A875RQF2_EENNA|nr:uncharacterized protein FOA43_004154 [Brettanomyces nanus]QPG76760.1 hypothetical protein FOA43_004154 [Brettanomyces nanus]
MSKSNQRKLDESVESAKSKMNMKDVVKQKSLNTGKKTRKKGKASIRKRKKLDTACVYCRRSHMICDTGRPCQRCIKRNIGHLCHDEPASKVKKQQLASTEEFTIHSKVPSQSEFQATITPDPSLKAASTSETVDAGSEAMVNATASKLITTNYQPQRTADENRILGLYKHKPTEQSAESIGYESGQKQQVNLASAAINQRPFFYSEHAGSEFNSLTEFLSMIDDTDVINSINMNNDPMLHKLETASALGYSTNNSSTNLNGLPQFESGLFSAEKSSASLQNQARITINSSQASLMTSFRQPGQSQIQLQQSQQQPAVNYSYQQLSDQPLEISRQSGQLVQPGQPLQPAQQGQPSISAGQSQIQFQEGATGVPYVSDAARDKFFLTAADPTTEISPEERLKQVINAKLEAGLLKPYNYAKGYQRLQNYMDNHMAESSRQRILKPLSTFRPGFRAVAKTLKDIDLVLVEENFERMLLDYDRVFTSMAIPACLWRRTGEIYRGNKEFASLVEVSIDDLKNGKLTIYELMTEESSVNFWEKYGAIAFDKTQKAVLTSCNLRTKDGLRKKNCCFSFTIRRDRYNIPSCIVGNFIPIQ